MYYMIWMNISSRLDIPAQGGEKSYSWDVVVEQERRRQVKSAYVWETPIRRLPDGACGGRPLHFWVYSAIHKQ